jgi:hypothetical protein
MLQRILLSSLLTPMQRKPNWMLRKRQWTRLSRLLKRNKISLMLR